MNPESGGEQPRREGRGRLLRLGFLGIGLVLLVWLVQRVGLVTLLTSARQVGWTFAVIVALYAGVHLLRAMSWRTCLSEDGKGLTLGTALTLWITGEAIAHLSFGWAGEPFRAAATRQSIPVERGLSALLVSRAIYSYAGLLLMTISVALCTFLVPLAGVLRLLMVTAAFLLAGISLAPFVIKPGPRRAVRSPDLSPPMGHKPPLLARVQNFIRTLWRDFGETFLYDRATFARLLAINFLAALVGVGEVYLVLRALGVPVGSVTALLIEGLSKVLALFALVVPGNVGIREGGTVLIFHLFALSAASAVTLVLVRRARALAWVGIGGLLLVLQGLGVLGHRTPENRSIRLGER